MATNAIRTRCCIAGGGPAGMMLGFLLARAGVDVTVLEKHGDFLRDFRGDTIHPSTLELMHELGLLDEFLKRPHQQIEEIPAQIGPYAVTIGDFSHLPTRCKFVALMPQWDFLNFLAEKARRYPSFHLKMNTEAKDLIVSADGTVTGVRTISDFGPLEIEADLVVAADGRHSILREKSGLEVLNLGAPIDVLWMRISRRPDDPPRTFGRVQPGAFMVLLDRGDYWQCAYVISKGGAEALRTEGIESFRTKLLEVAPFFRDRVQELKSWDDVKLLTVAVDRLKRWYRPGLLCIGDAAHAMSPIGGVGINLAIQDAVAAANILCEKLREGKVPVELLAKVEERRLFPTRAMQAVQVFAQNRIINPVLQSRAPIRSLPWPLKLLNSWPFLRRIPARVVGLGFRPEHIQTPSA
jgi:2-polyprenyl-6-methoxyphenol hydroxylase-like FAD-dependent oxidoreductase